MDHDDVQIRKVNARVDLFQNRIVPFFDLAEENTGQRIGSERNFAGESRQIHNRNDRAHDRRQQNILAFLAGRYFVNGLAAVRSAKVHIACQKPANSGLRADRVVCDFHLHVLAPVVGEPLRIDRVGECCAGPFENDHGLRQGLRYGQGLPHFQGVCHVFRDELREIFGNVLGRRSWRNQVRPESHPLLVLELDRDISAIDGRSVGRQPQSPSGE